MDYRGVKLTEIFNISDDREALTHGGVFHADDVFATALLKIVKPEIKIRRVTQVPEMYEGLVYDIGYGEYDHHQSEKRVRKNGIEYAAFGLLWEKLGPAMLGQEVADRIDKCFVEKIDYSDNTGCKNLLSDTISEFNPLWDEETPIDVCFDEAVDFAVKILKRRIQKEINSEASKQYVNKKLDCSINNCVILDKAMPWKSVLVGTTTEFVIYPSMRGGYMLQTVPTSNEDFTPVVALPTEWYGKEKEKLREISGVNTIIFCHPSGYIASAEKLEDVFRMVDIARKNAG